MEKILVGREGVDQGRYQAKRHPSRRKARANPPGGKVPGVRRKQHEICVVAQDCVRVGVDGGEMRTRLCKL